MRLKDETVNMDGVRAPILAAMATVESIMERYGEFVCTSARDGVHSARSLHYVGLAFDCRTWALRTPDQREEALCAIQGALGIYYEAFDERDHFHIEVSPIWLSEYGDPRPLPEVSS